MTEFWNRAFVDNPNNEEVFSNTVQNTPPVTAEAPQWTDPPYKEY